MLYVFYGSDISASRKKAHTLIDSLRAKKPDAAYEKFSGDDWSAAALESHLGGQGLFSNKYIIFLDRLTENAEAKDKISEFIPAMHESANIFIVLEGKLNAELKKAFEKSAEKIVVSDEKAPIGRFGGSSASNPSKRDDFNVFVLADAVGSRDPMRSWMVYRQAIDNGLESESILGTLFWQVKSMSLAREAKSAGESGLSPFVFSKSKRYAGNYSEAELKGLLGDLITLYHDGHRGIVDLELATERMMIGIGERA